MDEILQGLGLVSAIVLCIAILVTLVRSWDCPDTEETQKMIDKSIKQSRGE